jgi:hypothetical protein
MNRIKKEKKERKKGNIFSRAFNTLLNGEFLTKEGVIKHLPFLFFLTLLFILNISWIYYSENTIRELSKTKKELEELQSEYNTVSSKLETKKRQSSVARDIENLGLKEPTEPPIQLKTGSAE